MIQEVMFQEFLDGKKTGINSKLFIIIKIIMIMSQKSDIITVEGLKTDGFMVTENGTYIKFTPDILQNKKDACSYAVLRHILQSNIMIPHNLVGKPDDEFDVSYQLRMKGAKAIAAEFNKLTGKDLY